MKAYWWTRERPALLPPPLQPPPLQPPPLPSCGVIERALTRAAVKAIYSWHYVSLPQPNEHATTQPVPASQAAGVIIIIIINALPSSHI